MNIRRLVLTSTLLLFAAVPLRAGETIEVGPHAPPLPGTAPTAGVEPAPAKARPVDLAICLDTSGSMNGLIDAARQKLWAIVNDLALAKPSPDLRVSLVTFGNDGHDAKAGWVLVQTPLTSDLDLVSDKLFKLRTNGGTELVGRAVHTAMRDLAWSQDEQALKIVIVAGNESADQDKEISYTLACKGAIEKGVMVDAIFCGPAASPDADGWRQVARLADGHFANIDQENGTVVVATPFDEALSKLSASINGTYVPYGSAGLAGCRNQVAQDANASGLNSEAGASRAVSKAGCNYRNGHWDLVDATSDKEFDLAQVKDEDLPEDLRKLSLDERKTYIESKRAERAKIGKEIEELAKKRQAFIDQALAHAGGSADAAFDTAVRRAIRDQARSKGFTFADR